MANTNAAIRVGLQCWIAPAGKYTIVSGSGEEQTSTTVTINSENYPDMSNAGQQKIWRKIQSCISCEPSTEVTTVQADAPSGNGSILTPYAKEVVSSTRTLTLTLQSFDDFIAEVAFRTLIDPVTRRFEMDSEPMKEGWLYITGINRYGKIITAISGYCSFETSNLTLGIEDFSKPTLTATMLQNGKTLVNLFDPNMIITPSASAPGFDIFKTGLASDTTNNWRKPVANLTNTNDAVSVGNTTIASVPVFGVTGTEENPT